ncbi:MAG: DNA polymerase Y family protein [Planctomycetes bacterium]|nr:DNA polymerase Y family protein [Planctomycetota bacterium]
MQRRYAAIIIPMLGVQRLGRIWPALRRLPLAISRKRGPRVEISEHNRHAARSGIRIGMSLPQARAILSGLKVIEEQRSEDALWLEKIARWAQGYGPWVSIYADNAIVVEVSGSAHLFDSEAALLSHAKRGLARLGCLAKLALADTPRAAHALALSQREIAICPKGQTRSCLKSIGIDALSLPEGMVSELHALGLFSVGQLLDIPTDALDQRFEASLGLHLRQALGEVQEPPTPLPPLQRIFEEMLFDPPFSDGQSLFFVAKRLAEGLAERLQAAAIGARSLELRIKHLVGEDTLIQVEAAEALDRGAAMTLLLHTKLETLALAHPVEGVRLEAIRREKVSRRFASFFDTRRHRSHEAFASLVSRLEARLGRESVLGVQLVDDHRPTQAWQPLAFVEARPPETPCESSKLRPLQVFDPPQFADVMSKDGRPFVVNGAAVLACEGPERIRAGWWDDRPEGRDYYRVQVSSGEWLWIAFEHATRRFALVGVFA